ncbi:hypothetical protein PRBEI_2000709900 [Prionailurus iriomotensis]
MIIKRETCKGNTPVSEFVLQRAESTELKKGVIQLRQ